MAHSVLAVTIIFKVFFTDMIDENIMDEMFISRSNYYRSKKKAIIDFAEILVTDDMFYQLKREI